MLFREYLRAGLLIARMKANQWKSRQELEELQDSRLRKLVSYARENVPHYKKVLEGNGACSIDSLQKLPITEKNDVRRAPSSFISRRFDKNLLWSMSTSGSTGTPLQLFFDRWEGIYGSALRYHVLMECGLGPLDQLADLTQVHLPVSKIQGPMYRVSHVPGFGNSEEALENLKKLRPGFILGYPSTLSILAHLNESAPERLQVRTAISCSERLTAQARSHISRSFSCSVRDYYGSNESWALGWECERGSMHLNSDSVIMEVVDSEGRPVPEGEAGDVLITSLWRYSMPFIRYRIGDRAVLGGRCRCGRGLHVIGSLEGRGADKILLPSGKHLEWAALQVPLSEVRGLWAFQCIQERRSLLRILIVPATGAGACSENDVRAAIQSSLPEEVELAIEQVRLIPSSKSGKRPDFISKLGGKG